ncbi:glycoside hydrolase family 16 protein [Piedraia hortae CBS 480.64]|uniref:Glycoside hydrolase family 16 protein n=1 Tax=Piedraia hortae CBS 480.64 TaxID=1314780 RepID=A0A6A7C4K2_9PEZI|nr:glycoside hydrolase family 16 protein [Piedraia hortae CBS 480.64]
MGDGQTEDCRCGYFDPETRAVFTDSILVYFNETSRVPPDVFTVDEFEHVYEKGWTVYHREAASQKNVYFNESEVWNLKPQWLNLNVSGVTPQQVVTGAQLRSVRQDIQYDHFKVFMRSPAPYAGGSALTMRLEYNESASAELDLLNMDDSTNNACMQTSTKRQTPVPAWGKNYTELFERPYNSSPWDFWEYSMQWDRESITWAIGNMTTRKVPTTNASLVHVPSAFYLKHWSNGDANFMQGPPQNASAASIGWVRLFFNSSGHSLSQINSNSCNASQFCLTSDMTLRQSTDYTASATLPWTPPQSVDHRSKLPAIIAMVATSAIAAALIAYTLLHKVRRKSTESQPAPVGPRSNLEMDDLSVSNPAASASTVGRDKRSSGTSYQPLLDNRNSTMSNTLTMTSTVHHGMSSSVDSISQPDKVEMNLSVGGPEASSSEAKLTEGSIAAANPGAKAPPATEAVARTRIDYLAGLVAICSLLVSCEHFMLTFVPGVIMEYLPHHYSSEMAARKTIEPFVFNPIFVGLFFTTSTRFLTSSYLRSADLQVIAEKTVCRAPRLIIPIAVVILFEYFLLDVGAANALEYLPSLTWSPWPNVSVFPNFGWFLNETLQLLFLIPNGAPQVTKHFCTGVLWTIPVQLQNTWTVLLGAIVVGEIRTPWKRMSYYMFCIANGWYALSWTSYFWAGLLLADLDITYHYRSYTQSRWWLHYPLITVALVVTFLSLANDLISIHTGYNFSSVERGVHPDYQFAKPSGARYPDYTEPKLNGLTFAIAAQFLAENSTWTQYVLGSRLLLWFFPHVFTIYLIHGGVFWTVGSSVFLRLATLKWSFTAVTGVTALVSYVTLFALLPIVTPTMEFLGKELTKVVWNQASTKTERWKEAAWPLRPQEVRGLIYPVTGQGREC